MNPPFILSHNIRRVFVEKSIARDVQRVKILHADRGHGDAVGQVLVVSGDGLRSFACRVTTVACVAVTAFREVSRSIPTNTWASSPLVKMQMSDTDVRTASVCESSQTWAHELERVSRVIRVVRERVK